MMTKKVLHLIFGFLLAFPAAMGQMVEFDGQNFQNSSHDTFRMKCPTGSYCLVQGSFRTSAYGPTNPVVVVKYDRYEPVYEGYQFVAEGGFFSGTDCLEGVNCTALCDDTCTCETSRKDVSGNNDSGNCTVLQELPNTRIPDESELVRYVSSAVLPDSIDLRCNDFLALCEEDVSAPEYFRWQSVPADAQDFYYARDYSDCLQDGGSGEPGMCAVLCDPKCMCSESIENSSQACSTPPPTESPSELPPESPSDTSGAVASRLLYSVSVVVVAKCLGSLW